MGRPAGPPCIDPLITVCFRAAALPSMFDWASMPQDSQPWANRKSELVSGGQTSLNRSSRGIMQWSRDAHRDRPGDVAAASSNSFALSFSSQNSWKALSVGSLYVSQMAMISIAEIRSINSEPFQHCQLGSRGYDSAWRWCLSRQYPATNRHQIPVTLVDHILEPVHL